MMINAMEWNASKQRTCVLFCDALSPHNWVIALSLPPTEEVNRAMAAAKAAMASASQKAREAQKKEAQVEQEKKELREQGKEEKRKEKEVRPDMTQVTHVVLQESLVSSGAGEAGQRKVCPPKRGGAIEWPKERSRGRSHSCQLMCAWGLRWQVVSVGWV